MAPKKAAPRQGRGIAQKVGPKAKVAKQTGGYYDLKIADLKIRLTNRGAGFGGKTRRDDLIERLEELDGLGHTTKDSAKEWAKEGTKAKRGTAAKATKATSKGPKTGSAKVPTEEDEEDETPASPAESAPANEAPTDGAESTASGTVPKRIRKPTKELTSKAPQYPDKRGRPVKETPANGFRTGNRSGSNSRPPKVDDALKKTKSGKVTKATSAEKARAATAKPKVQAIRKQIRDDQGGREKVRQTVFGPAYDDLGAAIDGLDDIIQAETVEKAVAKKVEPEAEVPDVFEESEQEDDEDVGSPPEKEKDVEDQGYDEDESEEE
ncbi:hypothetical protein LTR36_007929 [Oleoguttula mirabilis]|uniref:Uncharacterized protein n=1 Tax=Oleoguttula mirabilis TaxID=1507867 RepID=A0AAV9J928_9PEZI|nr:hypothetical protein LTR36_007929 [Oleoguttula mirabilis]